MKRIIFLSILISGVYFGSMAQKISNIERSGSWYYIYDENGKKAKTVSASSGELVGYSSSIYILKSSSWYYIYNAEGKKLHTMSVSSVGEILSVTGDTFTSRSGSWIYTWNSAGKKINTRSAH